MSVPNEPSTHTDATRHAAESRRRAASRRAAIAVLAGLAAFAVLQIAAAAMTELLFPGVIDPDYGARLQRIRPDQSDDSARTHVVVMVGSSRVQCDLDAATLGESLSRVVGRPVRVGNFGVPGAGPLTELLTWRRLQRDGVRPDLLLVEVMPCFLRDHAMAEEMSDLRMPTSRLRWADLSVLERYRAGSRRRLRRDVALAEANALYSRRVGIVHALAPSALPRLDDGLPLVWTPGSSISRYDPPPEVRQRGLAAARAVAVANLPRLHADGDDCRPLHELLASCRDAGVPAALVLLPEGPLFRSWYPPETWQAMRSWLEEISRLYGAPIISAREWFEEDDFVDSHHLLPQGAARFTARLGREYVGPMLRRTSDGSGVSHE